MTDSRKTPRGTCRSECYDKIRACMEQHLRDYYQKHPERLMDQRSVEKVEMMRSVLVCILQIMDGYELTKTGEIAGSGLAPPPDAR
jgi:hypothetical protein